MSRRPKKPATGQTAEPARQPAPLAQRSARQKWVTVTKVPPPAAPEPDETERRRREEAERRQAEEARRARETTALAELQQQLGRLRAELLLQKNTIETLEADRERLRQEKGVLGRQAEKLRKDLERARTADPGETERLRQRVAFLERENEQ